MPRGIPRSTASSPRRSSCLADVALFRKNALFVGSDDGGVQLARLLSMPANCQMHGVAPERWLAVVLVRVG